MTARCAGAVSQAGTWEHVSPRRPRVPEWLRSRAEGWQGRSPSRGRMPRGTELVVRAVAVPTVSNDRRFGYVIADIPIDDTDPRCCSTTARACERASSVEAAESDAVVASCDTINQAEGASMASVFSRSVTFFDYHDWDDGTAHRAAVSMTFRLGDLYSRLSRAQPAQMGPLIVQRRDHG